MNNLKLNEIKENPIILDFKDCKYLSQVHSLLKSKFGFHDSYGNNWDALWDLMCDAFFQKTVLVELYNYHSLKEDVLEECSLMLQVFEDIKEKYQGFDYKIIS